MTDETKTDPTPAKPASPFDSPLVRHIVGVALSVALAFIAARYGIAPAPIPTLPTQSTPSVVIVSLAPNGTPMPLATVTGK